MQQYFYAPNVYPGDTSSLYVEDYPQSGNRYSYLWPFSRALVGTITLAGIPSSLDGGLEYQADVNDRLTGLSHYWDGAANPPGYDSYVTAPLAAAATSTTTTRRGSGWRWPRTTASPRAPAP